MLVLFLWDSFGFCVFALLSQLIPWWWILETPLNVDNKNVVDSSWCVFFSFFLLKSEAFAARLKRNFTTKRKETPKDISWNETWWAPSESYSRGLNCVTHTSRPYERIFNYIQPTHRGRFEVKNIQPAAKHAQWRAFFFFSFIFKDISAFQPTVKWCARWNLSHNPWGIFHMSILETAQRHPLDERRPL